jgi:hypothetical protein
MTQPVTCGAFERWLDEGADDDRAPAMRAHAAVCARCGEMLAGMDAIDRWLAEPPPAPTGFTDVVMNRIARLEHVRPAAWTRAPADALPWWAAILLQPAVVLAAVAAGLLIWRGDVLLRLALAGASWLSVAIPAASGHALDQLAALVGADRAAPRAGLGMEQLLVPSLGLGLMPVLAYASFAACGWVSRWVTRSSSIGLTRR